MSSALKDKEIVLLLGGTGFIGSNIVEYFCSNDQYKNKYYFIVLSRTNCNYMNHSATYEIGDYSDIQVLKKLFHKWKFTKVFHCATSTTPLSSSNNILWDIKDNLISTIGLLDVMREYGCFSIIYLSSGGAVYGEKPLRMISENEICEPMSSYGVIKLTVENYLKLYQKQFGIQYLILRVSNPFGKFHFSNQQGIINVAIRRTIKNEQIEIWGNGMQTKDYIYVNDLVKVIGLLIESNLINRVINVGSGNTYSLNSVMDVLKKHLPTLKVKYLDSKTTDVKNFCLDISILRSLINFEFTKLDEAIYETILWEKTRI